MRTGAVSNCNMVTGRFVSEHWRQCYTMQWHNTAHAVQGKVIVAGAWNNGPSSYRGARIDPDMINHFRSPLFHKQTDHNITKNWGQLGENDKKTCRCCNLHIVPPTLNHSHTHSLKLSFGQTLTKRCARPTLFLTVCTSSAFLRPSTSACFSPRSTCSTLNMFLITLS